VEPETQQQWYGGVLVTGTRELSSDERLGLEEMRRETRGDLWRAAGVVAVMLVVLCAGFVLGNAALALLLLLVSLWRAGSRLDELRAKLQFVRSSRRDVAEGVVAVCDPFEVLASSGLVWTYKGTRQHTISLLPRASTASVPEHARLAMNYVKPFDENVSVHQRPLSDAEVVELTGYAPDVPVVRGLFGALTIAAAIAALSTVPRYPAVIAASVAICIFIAWRLGRGLHAVLRVRRDVLRDTVERYVVIVRRTEDNQLFEVLPHSHYVWTEGGEPADWRRS
jgi:hypothetical protein